MASRPVSSAEVAFSPAGRMVATRGASAIELWDPVDGHLVQTINEPSVGGCHLTFNGNATMIASCERSGRIDVRQVPDGRIVRVVDGHPEGTFRLAFGTNGLLFSGGTDDSWKHHELDMPISAVRVWRLSDGKLLAKLPAGDAGDGVVSSLAVSSDGRWLAAGLTDRIALWPVTWK